MRTILFTISFLELMTNSNLEMVGKDETKMLFVKFLKINTSLMLIKMEFNQNFTLVKVIEFSEE